MKKIITLIIVFLLVLSINAFADPSPSGVSWTTTASATTPTSGAASSPNTYYYGNIKDGRVGFSSNSKLSKGDVVKISKEQWELGNTDPSTVKISESGLAATVVVTQNTNGKTDITTLKAITDNSVAIPIPNTYTKTKETKYDTGDSVLNTYDYRDNKYALRTTYVKSTIHTGDVFPYSGWSIDKNRNLLIDGKIVTKYVTDAGNNRAQLEDGSYIRAVQTAGEPIIVKQEGSTITLSQKGKDDLNVPSEIFGDEKTSPVTEDFIKNLPDMLTVAENNRIDRDSLTRDTNSLKSGDEVISFSGTKITYKDGANKAVEYTKEKESLYVSKTTIDGETTNWGTDVTTKTPYFETDTTRFSRVTDGNIVVYCKDGNKASGCINLDNGDAYYYNDKEQEWKSCDTKNCGKVEDEASDLDDDIEARRVAQGGPNDREQNAIKTFQIFEGSQTGFGKLASLFIPEESLVNWRRKVDEAFCKTVILGGTDCWISYVCDSFAGIKGDSTLIIEDRTGSNIPIAHIEAEMQTFNYTNNSIHHVDYLYKISFGVKTPSEYGDSIKFNVYLQGANKTHLFEDWQEVIEGSTFKRAGKKMLTKNFKQEYFNICLEFKDDVIIDREETIDKICNDIEI